MMPVTDLFNDIIRSGEVETSDVLVLDLAVLVIATGKDTNVASGTAACDWLLYWAKTSQ